MNREMGRKLIRERLLKSRRKGNTEGEEREGEYIYERESLKLSP